MRKYHLGLNILKVSQSVHIAQYKCASRDSALPQLNYKSLFYGGLLSPVSLPVPGFLFPLRMSPEMHLQKYIHYM